MTTINVSLTETQAKFVNTMTQKLGFANRSEFVRALLRHAQAEPNLIKQAQTWPFSSPSTVSKTKILKTLSSKKQHSDELLKDIKEGLNNSDYSTK